LTFVSPIAAASAFRVPLQRFLDFELNAIGIDKRISRNAVFDPSIIMKSLAAK